MLLLGRIVSADCLLVVLIATVAASCWAGSALFFLCLYVPEVRTLIAWNCDRSPVLRYRLGGSTTDACRWNFQDVVSNCVSNETTRAVIATSCNTLTAFVIVLMNLLRHTENRVFAPLLDFLDYEIAYPIYCILTPSR